MRPRALLLLLLGACASAPPSPPGLPPAPRAPRRHTLPAGTVLRLTPWTQSPASQHGELLGPAIDGLWREALRQSPHLDIAAGVEDTVTPFALGAHLDREASVASSTLLRQGQAPIPLASAAGELPAVLDRLALATRQALGEDADDALPIAAVYTENLDCAARTERALTLLAEGQADAALPLLRQARPRDPGCTITLAALAKALLARGSARGEASLLDEARRVAIDALQLPHRLAPTTKHRLAHLALVAQSHDPVQAPRLDRELLALGEAAARERPHDPHPRFSRALALSLLGRHAESAPLLRALHGRWPQSAEVAYHLTFAELASGQPQAALAAIRGAAPRLPRSHAVVPLSLALYHADRHDELRRWLAELAQDPVYRQSQELHPLRRMQAAHALLTDRRDDAVRLLLEDLEWIRQRPSELERHALDVAEEGEVLVLLGKPAELRPALQGLEDLGTPPPLLAQTLVLLGGLVEVAERGQRAEAAEAHLTQSGQLVWSSLVKASAHRVRGELLDELRERMLEYQSTESPLVRAELARVLDAAGGAEQAAKVRRELRARMLAFYLRRPKDHPLLGPGAALAWMGVAGA